MDKVQLRKMKQYLLAKNSAGGCMLVAARIIGIAAGASALACYISCIVDSDTSYLFPAIMSTFLSLFFNLMLEVPRIQAKKEHKKWIAGGRLEEMVADFKNAERPLESSDLVRLGNTWIFGSGCGRPVEYTSIRKLQVQTLKSNGMYLETTLYATLKNGESAAVCREIRKSQAGDAIAAAKKAIRSKMSNVEQA